METIILCRSNQLLLNPRTSEDSGMIKSYSRYSIRGEKHAFDSSLTVKDCYRTVVLSFGADNYSSHKQFLRNLAIRRKKAEKLLQEVTEFYQTIVEAEEYAKLTAGGK